MLLSFRQYNESRTKYGKEVRADLAANSNNTCDPNKNLCTLEVARGFAVENTVKYLHTYEDLLKAMRKKWKLKSSKTLLKFTTGKTSTTELRKLIVKNGDPDALAYVVYVKGHIMAMNKVGVDYVDTSPKETKDKHVQKVWAVYS